MKTSERFQNLKGKTKNVRSEFPKRISCKIESNQWNMNKIKHNRTPSDQARPEQHMQNRSRIKVYINLVTTTHQSNIAGSVVSEQYTYLNVWMGPRRHTYRFVRP